MDVPDPGRRRWAVLAAVATAVVLAAAFAWFRPDALFTDRTVDEQLDPAVVAALAATPAPTPSPSPAPTAVVTPRTSATPTRSATPSPTPPPITTSTPRPTPTSAPTPESTPTSESTPPAVPPEPAPTTTADPTPSAAPPEPAPGPTARARGEWISLEHETSGTVILLDDGGDLQLVLSDLATSNGPDLRVILSPKAGVEGDWYGYEDGATYLGALKGNRGTQVYDVPDDVDVDDVASAVIWCERFTVGFGVATLS